jgi:hypothetical protein
MYRQDCYLSEIHQKPRARCRGSVCSRPTLVSHDGERLCEMDVMTNRLDCHVSALAPVEKIKICVGKGQTMSIDDLSAEQKKQVIQFVFWNAVVVIGGYVVLFVI